MDDLLNMFDILSDRTRLRILLLLRNHELCVCEIFGALNLSQPRVSRQLAVLKQSRIIKDRREGKWIYYQMNESDENSYLLQILSKLPHWLKDDPEFVFDQEMLQKVIKKFDLPTFIDKDCCKEVEKNESSK